MDDDLTTLEENIVASRHIWFKVLDIYLIAHQQAHDLFYGHALKQHKRLGGLGDKTEDLVEKGHQLGMRDERRTYYSLHRQHRIRFFASRLLIGGRENFGSNESTKGHK